MGMTTYQWVMLGLGALGFIGTWILGAFKLGRVVEQMRAAVKEDIDEEREKIIAKIETMEARFEDDQKTQDRNFGEVGHAMREKIASVESKIREVEIYGRDNYVKIPDFEKAIDRLGETMTAGFTEIKEDIRRLLKPQ
jgi:hypothetical protein